MQSLLVIAILFSPAPILADMFIYKEGTPTPFIGNTYSGTEDTELVVNGSLAADQNFGSRNNMEVGSDGNTSPRHSLIRFDLTSAAGQLNPNEIVSVMLRLYVSNTDALAPNDVEGAGTIQAFRLADANTGWVEGTESGVLGNDPADNGMSTWSQRIQGSEDWAGSAGASTAGTDYLNTLLADQSFDANTTSPGSSFDLIFNDFSFVSDWIAGNNAGLLLRGEIESGENVVSFFTSDFATTSFRPELIIETPEPTSLLIMCGAAIGTFTRLRRNKSDIK